MEEEIIIRLVTRENVADILGLEPGVGQESFIETTAQCIEEARENNNWRLVGIYNHEAIIGFAMYGYFEEYGGRRWLDRFMIDAHYQGRGYGSVALDMLIRRLYDEYSVGEIYLSVYPTNEKACHMYERHGFCNNGEYDCNGETVMVLQGQGTTLPKKQLDK